MIQRWAPVYAIAIVLGVPLVWLLVNEPSVPDTVRNLEPVYYPEPVAKPGFELTKTRMGTRNVSAYVLSRTNAGDEPRPAVVLVHGGSIVDLLEYKHPQYKGEWFIPRHEHIAYGLAEAGFLVVAIDNWWAGERYEPRFAEMAQAAPIRNIFRAWVETRYDVSSVIDVLVARDDVNPKRIGVAGWSGGGIVSTMTIAHDPRVYTIVAWKAGPDYMTKIQLRGQTLLAGDALDKDEAFIQELKTHDAFYHLEAIPPRPIALIGNERDPAMPRQLAERFVEELKPYYEENPERLRLSLYKTPRPTHDLTPESLVEGRDWLIRWLSEPAD
jgi:uncharacterized protein